MIIGLTDKPVIRRDGKIRAGIKNDKDYPVNTPYFVLHDAAQLIPVLGEKPTEIYFTVYFDDINAVAPTDLRWYTKSELVCMGNAETAAYFGMGDLAGLRQKNAELRTRNPDGAYTSVTIPRSRERICAYKTCNDYIAGKCSEHLLLDMVIPHHSMCSLFTLESTSIYALMNIISAFQKTQTGRGGKISGEIFRLYKDKMELSFEGKDGKKSKSEKDVIFMSHVPFDKYAGMYKDKCSVEDWQALMALRSSGTRVHMPHLAGPDEALALAGGVSHAASLPAPDVNDDEEIKKIANHVAVMPLFDEIAQLLGKENTESARVATARNSPGVDRLMSYLKVKITELKKKKATVEETAPQMVAPAAHTQTQPSVGGLL